jgi:aryl-alcohol dehydrogenase-like predicted oxidoreductase
LKFLNKYKLVLGTAQLNSSYGITNSTYKNTNQIYKFLDYAYKKKIRIFDTAPSYNNHKLLGNFIKSNNLEKEVKVLTKLPTFEKKNTKYLIEKNLEKFFNDLKTEIEVLFLHDVGNIDYFIKNLDFFINLISKFPIKRLGFSIYKKKDIQKIIELKFKKNYFAYQFPANLLNREFKDFNFNSKWTYARSIFLQGLLLSDRTKYKLPNNGNIVIKNYHKKLGNMNLDPLKVSISYINSLKNINHLIFGFDNIIQINSLLHSTLYPNKSLNFLNKSDLNYFSKINDPRVWK